MSLSWEDYVIEQKIGTGAFSTVYRALHKKTSSLVAIKAIKRSKLSKKQQSNLRLEQSILKSLDDEHVVQLYEIMKTEKHIYLIMEHCGGGDLSSYIKARGKLSETMAIHCLREIALGLKVLFDRSLIHRDLKPQNLLLGDPVGPGGMPSLKLADFGLARYIEEEDLAATLCGSPTYMAPEVLSGKPYSAKADLWSVGAIFFEMLTGTPPFIASNHIELLRKMQRAPPPIPRHTKISSTSRYLIQSCLLIVKPEKRIGFDEFFTHPYVTYSGPIVNDLASSAAAAASAAAPAASPARHTLVVPPSVTGGHSDDDDDDSSSYYSYSDDDEDAAYYQRLAAKHGSSPPQPSHNSSFSYSSSTSDDDHGDNAASASARKPLVSKVDNVLQEELARLEQLKARHRATLASRSQPAAAPAAAAPAPSVPSRSTARSTARSTTHPAIPARASTTSTTSASSTPAAPAQAPDFDIWRQRAMEKIMQMNALATPPPPTNT